MHPNNLTSCLKRGLKLSFVLLYFVFLTPIEGISQEIPYQLIVPDLPTKDLKARSVAKVNDKLYFVSEYKFYSLDVQSGINEEITTSIGSFPYTGEIQSVGNKLVLGGTNSNSVGGQPVAFDPSTSEFTVLKIINTSGPSNPQYFYENGGYLYFTAFDGSAYHLWRTDGTNDETIQLSTDAFPNGARYTPLGTSTLVLGKSSGNFYDRLYLTDGTTENTTLIKDFSLDSDPGRFSTQYEDNFPVPGTSIVFVILRSSSREVWYSDGTAANTEMLFSIDNSTGYISQLTVLNSDIYYNKYLSEGGVTNSSLMKYSFLADLSEEVKSFPGKSVGDLHANASFLILTVDQSLWVSDGSNGGTTLLAEGLSPGYGNSPFLNMADDKILITGYSSETGTELWSTDGTTGGTFQVKDIFPGPTSGLYGNAGQPLILFENEALYMLADSPGSGVEFWVSDGTSEGTNLIADVNSSPAEPSISDHAQNENYLVAEINGASNTVTHLLEKSSHSFQKIVGENGLEFRPNKIVELNNSIYFLHHSEPVLYSIDPNGELSESSFQESKEMSSILSLFKAGNKLIFTASTPSATPPTVDYNTYLSDGTSEETFPVGSFYIETQWFPESFGMLNENELLLAGGDFFNNNTYGVELRKIDVETYQSSLIKDIVSGEGNSNPFQFKKNGDSLFFFTSDEDDEYHPRYLWKSNGASNGTSLVYDFEDGGGYQSFSLGQNLIILTADNYGSPNVSLWKSDGTTGGTSLLRSIGDHAVFSSIPPPYPVVQGDNYLLFFTNKSSGVFDISIIDLDLEETIILEDKGALKGTWKLDNLLFFLTADGELYRTDGSKAGTTLISDYFTSDTFAQINGFASFDDLAIVNIAHNNVKEIWAQSIFYSDIEVLQNTAPIVRGASYDLGSAAFNTESATTYSFAIKNNGLINLNFDQVISSSISGNHANDFVVKNASFENKIGPDEEGVLEVFFKPTATGTRTATLTLNTNDEDTPTFTVLLSGQGVKASQSVVFDELADRVFGDSPFELIGSASSGLSVSYSSSDNAVLSIEDNVATIVNAGTVTVTASQAGNDNFEAAASVEQSLTINQATQTITFDPLPEKTYGDAPFDLSATASSGLDVTFSSSDAAVASVEGVTVSILKAGAVTITASQAGNDNYSSATATQSLTINKAAQTITFATLPAKTFGDEPFALSASSTSGLTVAYASNDATVAKVDGTTVTLLKPGSVTVTASQSGNENYLDATSVEQSLVVNKAGQTITFEPLATKTYGDPAFELSATSSVGLPVTFSSSDPAVVSVEGNSASIVKAGAVTITTFQAGNDNYNAASAEQTLTIAKASQTITFDELPTLQSDDAPIALVAEASSGLPVLFQSEDETIATMEGATLTITGSGTTSITATQGGDENYLAAEEAVRTLVVEEVTGLKNELAGQIKVYPNPAYSTFFVEHAGLPIGRYTIVSISGEPILQGVLERDGFTVLPTSSLNKGIYLLTISSDERTYVCRIIKN